MTSPELYDVTWLAERIGKTVDWISHNIADIPHRKIGRAVRFTEQDLTDYLEAVRVTPRRMHTTGRRRTA